MEMTLQKAFALFRRLGVNGETMTRAEFRAAYFRLARRYHPDVNPRP
jgi:curved DNA-binding protein CbpA